MNLSMEAVEQADQAVDQAVLNIEEDVENNADEALTLDIDNDNEVDDLNMGSDDPDEDSGCDFSEEQRPF